MVFIVLSYFPLLWFLFTVFLIIILPSSTIRVESALKTRTMITLSQFLENSKLSTGIVKTIQAFSESSKEISFKLRDAAFLDILGSHDEDQKSSSPLRDKPQQLDVISNDICKSNLLKSGVVSYIASEEDDNIIETGIGNGIAVCYDPLDGSSNIDCASPTGTIFGIYEISTPENILKSLVGNNLKVSGYILYSSSTELVFTIGDNSVNGFSLNSNTNEFILTRENIRIPVRGFYYSLNDGKSSDWPQGLSKYISDIKDGKGEAKHRYNSRYVCSLVADLHRTILYGGWCGNPRSHLRLLFEAAPLAFLVENGGGAGSDGLTKLTSITPREVHHRLPVFLGSVLDIKELEKYKDVQQK